MLQQNTWGVCPLTAIIGVHGIEGVGVQGAHSLTHSLARSVACEGGQGRRSIQTAHQCPDKTASLAASWIATRCCFLTHSLAQITAAPPLPLPHVQLLTGAN